MVLTDQAKAEARDAFVVFDENYEGDNIDAFYLGDICRALGCNCTNGTLKSVGMTDELGQKRITFEEFLPILEQSWRRKNRSSCSDFSTFPKTKTDKSIIKISLTSCWQHASKNCKHRICFKESKWSG